MIVASPWTRGGYVNSQLFDHTSTLMFLESFIQAKHGKTVREENINPWRRSIAGDLTSIFRPYDRKAAAPDPLDRDKFVVSIEKAKYREVPSAFTRLTAEQIALINRNPVASGLIAHQEEGTRPSCALPYELYADGAATDDGTHFELRLTAANAVHGSRAAGAPFNVYLRGLKDKPGASMTSATYAVRAGDTLTPKIPLELFADAGYLIEVVGPNGFYRSFAGKSASPVEVRTAYERAGSKPTGNLQLALRNKSNGAATITIADNSYKSAAISRKLEPGQQATITLPTNASRGWYDFTVNSEGSSHQARYAGHVETGAPSISDPRMGNVV
jgi:phospholipase C